ncbi:toll/interleukin-1 receptor domain-containing protein [Altererythrobacter arenosus]|uniref:Toll/interleukin-1 receptor domain-containing protein n=1 Tax=Altererythrobacter arenosus TaxID=3032592 RepID=A0ABY8FWG5_9SPHN|nr:toll/interleukin-1 receptor domain-containing protein [Altererythrobacter sp. CAU 1644]WFL78410.1 toll/interleukin-1 receptor domain-containing protein [Altererythrobacter sp. CAU 1644]
MADRQYKAFISYSHRDKAIASWLHRALETYRFPKGKNGAEPPERLHPIFKDREELPAADSLGEAIDKAIEHSDALIVLCSPDSANSPWIAKEVDAYKRLNGDRNVFPVIVAGEPPANFPAPLLVHYENGEPTDREAEPIAADLRPEADGKKLAKLKLVAGLAGVDLDTLVQRDAARRQRRMAAVAAASLVGMVGTSGLALYAIDQRNEAREQRAEADGLIEYMLTDLREQLEPVGRLEVLDGVGKRAMAYYTRQKLEDLSATELGRRVRAVQLVAEVQNLRGNNQEALPAFEQAARTTAELLARRPDDPVRMYNHGQSLFWVGYIAWQHGKMGEAREAMEAYADISTRLAAMDRSNLEWQMEESYSLSNLGTMDFEEGKLSSALDYFERSLVAVDKVSQAEGRPVSRQVELGESHSWVSTTLLNLGRIKESSEVRRAELAIYAPLEQADPANSNIAFAQVSAKAAMGFLLMQSGKNAEARQFLDDAIAGGEKLIAADPANTFPRELIRPALRERALLAWNERDAALSARLYDRLEQMLRELQRKDPDNYEWNIENSAQVDIYRVLSDPMSGPPDGLIRMASQWRARLNPNDLDSRWMLVALDLIDGLAHERSGKHSEAREAFRRALGQPQAKGERVSIEGIALRAVAAERIGEREQARTLRQRLKELGVDPPIDDAITRRSRN